MTWLNTTKDIIEPPERSADAKFSSGLGASSFWDWNIICDQRFVAACHMHPCGVAAASKQEGDGIESVMQTARSKRRQLLLLYV